MTLKADRSNSARLTGDGSATSGGSAALRSLGRIPATTMSPRATSGHDALSALFRANAAMGDLSNGTAFIEPLARSNFPMGPPFCESSGLRHRDVFAALTRR